MLLIQFNELKSRLSASREELLDAQRQVFHAEKLASIGRFASGIAHEINNPLNGIENCLYAIEKEPENLAQTREYLTLATEGLEAHRHGGPQAPELLPRPVPGALCGPTRERRWAPSSASSPSSSSAA